VSFIAWSEDGDRAEEIAAALGGEARIFYDLHIVRKPLVPLRYLLSALRMAAYLVRRRPRTVIVTNPPIFPGLIAFAYGRLAGAGLVLDSHPSAFGDAALSKTMMSVHAWLAQRARTTLVTVEPLAEIVRGWGATADIVHEARPRYAVRRAQALGARPRVLYIGRFVADEPTAEVVKAAALTPEVDLYITGDVRKCPADLRRSAPPNAIFTGFLRGDDYRRAIEDADIVLVLTNHRMAVNRGAYEAVYARRPLIISDLPAMRPLFPHAIAVENDGPRIAEGIQEAVGRHAALVAAADDAMAVQEQRWRDQLGQLSARMSGDAAAVEDRRRVLC
jgi:Glycosyl transferases group 1